MQAALEKRGGRVLAISVDPPAKSKSVVERNRLPFPILADENREVIGNYGVRHRGGGPNGSDIAIPASFLIERDGVVIWRHVSELVQDRPDPALILSWVEKLRPAASQSQP